MGVTVADVLDPATSVVGYNTPQGTCSGTIDCDLGTVPAGAILTITVDVAVPADYPTGIGALTNSASLTTDTPDPDPSNNTDSAAVDVDAIADLSIAKAADADTVLAGNDITWTITVTNDGPSDAQDVTVSDP